MPPPCSPFLLASCSCSSPCRRSAPRAGSRRRTGGRGRDRRSAGSTSPATAAVRSSTSRATAHVFLSRTAGGAWQRAGARRPRRGRGGERPGRGRREWRRDRRRLAVGGPRPGRVLRRRRASARRSRSAAATWGRRDVDLAIKRHGLRDRSARAATCARYGCGPTPGRRRRACSTSTRPSRRASARGGRAWPSPPTATPPSSGREGHPDGRARLYARRVTDLRPSAAPQEVSLAEFGGRAGRAPPTRADIDDRGRSAPSPGSSGAQDFGGVSRTFARRLVGSLFEAPAAVDPGGAARAPRVEMTAAGLGLAARSRTAASVAVSLLTARRVRPPRWSPAAARRRWRSRRENRDAGGRSGRRAVRFARAATPRQARALEGAVRARRGRRGRAAGRGPHGRPRARLAQRRRGWWLAVWDEAAGRAARLRTNRTWKAIRRPVLRWSAGRGRLGARCSHRVLLDGRRSATTGDRHR